MPVALLFCEGGGSSPDAILLNHVLAGTGCEIRPGGGKHELSKRIMATRAKGLRSAGIRDRDFDDEESSESLSLPQKWSENWDDKEEWLGWQWERREIENYLLDPQVVQKALGDEAPDPRRFEEALTKACTELGFYMAARHTLSSSRRRFERLENRWGRKRGQGKHPLPDERTEKSCRQALKDNLQKWMRGNQVNVNEVMARFESFIPLYQAGGVYYERALTFFAGKDILYTMEPELTSMGFISPLGFRNKVISGIEKAADAWTWLPEWGRLRQEVMKARFP